MYFTIIGQKNVILVIYYSFKIFSPFWLARLNRHNQLVLDTFWKCLQYTIDFMVYLHGNEVDDGLFA